MMKKTILLVMACTINWFQAQCTITGAETLSLNQEATYKVEAVAQCPDCYHWSILNNGEVNLVSESKSNSIRLKTLKPGKVKIGLTALTKNGMLQCDKEIQVIESDVEPQNLSTKTNLNCDIDVKDFKEFKYDAGQIIFIPLDTEKPNKYNWTAVYKNLEEKLSNKIAPVFSTSVDNPIVEIKATVISPYCTKKISKTYTDGFWKYFEN
jgi:hypothetical protein